MEQQQLPLPGPRISRVTIARLHNLGNYEHVRYEVTVELPPGTSPASVLRALEDMLNALEPKRPVSAWSLRDALELLAKPEPTLQPKDADGFISSDTPEQVLRRAQSERERARDLVVKHEAWLDSRDAALSQFDELGGTKVYVDAKPHWDDGQ